MSGGNLIIFISFGYLNRSVYEFFVSPFDRASLSRRRVESIIYIVLFRDILISQRSVGGGGGGVAQGFTAVRKLFVYLCTHRTTPPTHSTGTLYGLFSPVWSPPPGPSYWFTPLEEHTHIHIHSRDRRPSCPPPSLIYPFPLAGLRFSFGLCNVTTLDPIERKEGFFLVLSPPLFLFLIRLGRNPFTTPRRETLPG